MTKKKIKQICSLSIKNPSHLRGGSNVFRNIRRTFNFRCIGKSSEIRRKYSEVAGTFPDKVKISRILLRKSWQVSWWDVDRKKTKKDRSWIILVKTCNCFLTPSLAASYTGAFSEGRKFEIISHLQQLVHDTHGFCSKSRTKYDTYARLAAKITPKKAHLITLSVEKMSGTMIFKALKTGFIENKGQSGPLSVVSKT